MGECGRRVAQGPRLVVMGVSGCGKTTVGALLAARLQVPFVDGDSLHPQSNVDKMRAGIPLTDADRAPWLDRVGATLAQAGDAGIVVACSALKRVYRDTILGSAPTTLFLHLSAPHDLIAKRLGARHGHFMPAALLDSQFAALEPLAPGEPGWVVDARVAASAIADVIEQQLAARRLA